MKNKLASSRLLFMAILICLIHIGCNAQPSGKPQEVSVSVSGIDYDDASFTLLREKLKSNRNVSDLKESYNNGSAAITFTYTNTAINLWDQMPSSVKQLFKVTSIDDQHIILSGKNSSSAAPSTTANNYSTSKDDDCKTCYYNLCKYDETKTFQGVLYKGINWDQGTYYYNCDNGVVTRKIITTNAAGVITSITTDTLIMSNVPAGTSWEVTQSDDGTSYSGYTLIAKNLSVNVNNKQYNDVIIVNIRQYNHYVNTGSSINYYYARGVGLIASDQLDYKKDPMQVYQSNLKAEAIAKSLPGQIDPRIVGVWKWGPPNDINTIYKFNSDGTFNYYTGSNPTTGQDMYKNSKNFWRLNGNTLEVYYSGMNIKAEYGLQKTTDAATGKPALNIQFRGTEYRTYVELDSK
ncbi:MAG: hypothetical protein KGM16_01180 [Bacteroidota bacterium]|nr:hypothetical protein [Bacteroidota bacterium]